MTNELIFGAKIQLHNATRAKLAEVLASRRGLKEYRQECPTLFATLTEMACELISMGARNNA